VAEEPITREIILAAFPFGEDRISLASILRRTNWKLRLIRTFHQARTTLRTVSVGAVISDAQLFDGYSWKDLLHEIQEIMNPPPLIVADRLADERLWAEVLNLGAYDLLTKPFDGTEVLRVMSMACRFHDSQRERMVGSRQTREKRYLDREDRACCG